MKHKLLYLFICCSTLATAQTYPFADGFQSYSNFSTLGTQGGYMSDMSVYQTHGMGNSDKGLLSQMNNFNTKDSTISPLIGPLTASSQLSFYYRIMNPAPQYPFVPATIGTGDVVEVYLGIQTLSIYQLAYTINSTNNVADTSFKKITITVPGSFANQSGNVKFIVRHPANGNDYNVDIDSLVVRDSISLSIPLTIAAVPINVNCHGICDGSAQVTASGGTGPYTFAWGDTSLTAGSRTNLCAGTYTATVTDNLSATASTSFTITEPDALVLTDSVTHVTCHGGADGCINLIVTGGITPYFYTWSSGTNTEDTCTIAAGNYAVTVIDGNNCYATISIAVSEPTPLTFTTTFTNPTAIHLTDGTIQFSASGSTPGYSFSIDSGSSYSNLSTFNGLGENCYHVFVKDTNNCVAGPDTVCLTDPTTGILDVANETMTVYPNPATDYIMVKTNRVSPGELSLINSVGEMVFNMNVTDKETRLNLSALSKGNYMLNLKTATGNQRKLITLVR